MNILLVYGGKSCEHDISIITGCLAKGYFEGNVVSGYLSQNNQLFLVQQPLTPKQHKEKKFAQQIVFLLGKKQIAIVKGKKISKVLDIDVVVNCCHGRCGDDGAIAALCNLANLPLVGSNLIPSAVAMDKDITKAALVAKKFPVVKGVVLKNSGEGALQEAEKLGYPIIVKPCTLGSSIGICRCNSKEELKNAIDVSLLFDEKVLCERALENFYEANCAVMRTQEGVVTSAVEMPLGASDILSFHDKYLRGEKFSAAKPVAPNIEAKVKKLAADIFDKLCLAGVVRIDFLIQKDKVFVNEINSVPGSLAYSLWQKQFSPKQFGKVLVQSAVAQFDAQKQKIHEFHSQVLECGCMKK